MGNYLHTPHLSDAEARRELQARQKQREIELLERANAYHPEDKFSLEAIEDFQQRDFQVARNQMDRHFASALATERRLEQERLRRQLEATQAQLRRLQ